MSCGRCREKVEALSRLKDGLFFLSIKGQYHIRESKSAVQDSL